MWPGGLEESGSRNLDLERGYVSCLTSSSPWCIPPHPRTLISLTEVFLHLSPPFCLSGGPLQSRLPPELPRPASPALCVPDGSRSTADRVVAAVMHPVGASAQGPALTAEVSAKPRDLTRGAVVSHRQGVGAPHSQRRADGDNYVGRGFIPPEATWLWSVLPYSLVLSPSLGDSGLLTCSKCSFHGTFEST